MAQIPRKAWEPQPGPQEALVECITFEVFYGGARGGGKTDGMLGEWCHHAQQWGDKAIGIFFRRSLVQLDETIERAKVIFGKLGAEWHESSPQYKTFKFPNGARLKFRHLEKDGDAELYQGHSYSRVYFEELTNYPSDAPYRKLMATLRSADGVTVGMRATGNPGGPGHSWVKQRFIDPAPGGYRLLTEPGKARSRVFIPAKLADNPRLLNSDPHYIEGLQSAGSAELVRAWLDGDWDVIQGAYFDNWRAAKHVIEPFAIPEHWMRFRSFDWGSARPFHLGWWAVSDGEEINGRYYPTGSMICYREWYGMKEGEPNVGLKLTAEQVARGIVERQTKGERFTYSVADPSAFANDGGPSIAERMHDEGVAFHRADNKRVGVNGAMGGWDQLRARLDGEEGRPMIYWFSTCVDTIRTLPVLQHDERRPEDVNTESEDHCFVAGTLVSEPHGPTPIEQLPATGLIHTPQGLQPYHRVRRTAKMVPVNRLTFSDGSAVVCTPDHKFLTYRGEWVQARDMQGERSYAAMSCPSRSATQPKSSRVSATTFAIDIINARARACIEGYGSVSTALSRKATTSTTGTATPATTSWRIWSFSLGPSIFPFTMPSGFPNIAKIWRSLRDLLLGHGTAPRLAGNGIGSTITRTALASSTIQSGSGVTFATHGLRDLLVSAAVSAPMPANPPGAEGPDLMTFPRPVPSVEPGSRQTDIVPSKRVRAGVAQNYLVCVGVEPDGLADVWCLTVPEAGSFMLANGAAVANCADSVRYACMSRPYVKVKPAKPLPITEPLTWNDWMAAQPEAVPYEDRRI